MRGSRSWPREALGRGPVQGLVPQRQAATPCMHYAIKAHALASRRGCCVAPGGGAAGQEVAPGGVVGAMGRGARASGAPTPGLVPSSQGVGVQPVGR